MTWTCSDYLDDLDVLRLPGWRQS